MFPWVLNVTGSRVVHLPTWQIHGVGPLCNSGQAAVAIRRQWWSEDSDGQIHEFVRILDGEQLHDSASAGRPYRVCKWCEESLDELVRTVGTINREAEI